MFNTHRGWSSSCILALTLENSVLKVFFPPRANTSMKHAFDERNCYEMKRLVDVLSANLLKVSVTSCKFGVVPGGF